MKSVLGKGIMIKVKRIGGKSYDAVIDNGRALGNIIVCDSLC